MNRNSTSEWFDKVILLVEDEAFCRYFFQIALRKTGVKLLYAHNGIEAITMVETHPDIDLILMDIQLPVMDGLEATRRIKQIRPKLTIIAQSAYTMNDERQKAINAGCDDYLSKPVRVELLIEKIEKYFITN